MDEKGGIHMERVILGMSGGVDSSVSAWLLKEQGYEVVGLFMKNWDETDPSGVCTATDDSIDAKRVAASLDLPCYTVNFESEYSDRVFAHFLKEYKRGRTPNPDVLCNQEIKFGAFLHYALGLEGSRIAMGHYADTRQVDGRTHLLRGADPNKDQSYFLARTPEEGLAKCLFPLGKLQKSEVRAIAKEQGLATADKKDSTGICFIGERDFRAFLSAYLSGSEGDMVDPAGKTVGHHEGLMHYTLGQRKGLGIGGIGTGEPWFVAGKDPQTNKLYVVQGAEHPALYSRGLQAEDPVWIGPVDAGDLRCTAKVRYRQTDVPCTVRSQADGTLSVVFDTPVRAATPGQTIAFYDKERCLGGAIIASLDPMDPQYAYMNPAL